VITLFIIPVLIKETNLQLLFFKQKIKLIMKLRLQILTLALLFCTISYAQLPTGSIAPDFTVVDIEGNEHHLYEILDEGKTVVIDFFGTWCDACWNHHQEAVLHELWELNGPDGANDYFVMMIEPDPATTNADLFGTGPNTEGNWVESVPFPIIEDVSVGSDFMVSFLRILMLMYQIHFIISNLTFPKPAVCLLCSQIILGTVFVVDMEKAIIDFQILMEM
jgi:hypothetical protein